MSVDFGRTTADYCRFRAGFPAEFFARIESLGLAGRGSRVLDLGTGPGTIALNLARRGARVTALDPALPMLEATAAQARAEKLEIATIEGKAESTELPAAQFDLVIAGQCWHWFDRPRAAAEVRRLLVPAGPR